MASDQVIEKGARVRIPDGREGTVLWVIPSGQEAAVSLPGVYGTFHIHPKYLVLLGRE